MTDEEQQLLIYLLAVKSGRVRDLEIQLAAARRDREQAALELSEKTGYSLRRIARYTRTSDVAVHKMLIKAKAARAA